jgi:hypothetical protein
LTWERQPSVYAVVDVDLLRTEVAAHLDWTHARSSDAKVGALLTDVRARYGERENLPWDAAVAGLVTHFATPSTPLIDLFIAEAGLAGAIDALVASVGYGRYEWRGEADQIQVHNPDGPGVYWTSSLASVLRARLLAAPEAEYSVGRDHARALRSKAPLSTRCLLAFLFPAEPSWAADELARLGADKDPPGMVLLLVPSLDSPAQIEHLANTHLDFTAALADGRVAMAIRRFGLASLPFARRLFVKRTARAGVVDALVHLEAPEVAALLLTVFGDIAARPAVTAYLRAHPALALPALTRASVSKKENATLMAPLLASIVDANRTLAISMAASAPPKERALLTSLGASDTWVPETSPAIERILATRIDDDAARMAWDRLVRWVRAKGPGSESACIADVAKTGDPGSIALLAQLARATSHRSGVACALAIVDALEATNTSAAAREIARLTIDLTKSSLAEHAELALRRIQLRQGLDDEDVLDWCVPDFGIHGASISLDFGPRAYRVELDASFTPRLFDERGTLLKSLPRANKKDDAAKAAQAAASWAALRDEGTAEARQQARRFESAMVGGRAWRMSRFREVILTHPILSRIAMRLLWATSDGQTLRVAEDASLADVHDASLLLGDDVDVRVVHRLELTSDALYGWGKVFADYEILPPFEQLSREVARLDDTSHAAIASALSPFAGRPLKRSARHVLEAQGWVDTFHYTSLSCTRAVRGLEVTVDLELPAPDAAPTTLMSASAKLPEGAPFADPIAIGELLRDLGKIVDAAP